MVVAVVAEGGVRRWVGAVRTGSVGKTRTSHGRATCE